MDKQKQDAILLGINTPEVREALGLHMRHYIQAAKLAHHLTPVSFNVYSELLRKQNEKIVI
jgi:hypothetical protein